jgi:hypothetical protein
VDGDYRVHLKPDRDASRTLCGIPAFETPMREQRREVTCEKCRALRSREEG